MILTKEVEVGLGGQSAKYYEKLNYNIPRRKDKYGNMTVAHGTKIFVKVEDLPKGSMAIVEVLCDYCNINVSQKTYKSYLKSRKVIPKDCCASCQSLKSIESNIINYGVKNASQREDVKLKKEQTNLINCGETNHTKSKEYRIAHSRENHPNWKGGKKSEYDLIRNSLEYKQWRNEVFRRDNYTCQCCGDNSGGNLEAHHILNFIDNESLRFDIENGITLCSQCHNPNKKFSFHNIYGTHNNTKEQLEEYINNYKQLKKNDLPQSSFYNLLKQA